MKTLYKITLNHITIIKMLLTGKFSMAGYEFVHANT